MGMIAEGLKAIGEAIANYVKENPKKAIGIGLGAVGGASATVGATNTIKANKKNKEAQRIRDEALRLYNVHESKAKEALNKFGQLRLEVASSFEDFIDAISSIQGRPRGLSKTINNDQLSKHEAEELKILSNNARTALASAGGLAVGSAIGVAAFGLSPLVLGPGVFVGGVVFCIKGVSINKKATKNKKEALHLRSEIDKIVIYLQQLSYNSNILFQSMSTVNILYQDHLTSLKKLVSVKSEWKSFTKNEKQMVKNTIRLVKLMNEMCKTQLVLKSEKETELEKVNEKAVRRITNEAANIVSSIKPVVEYSTT